MDEKQKSKNRSLNQIAEPYLFVVAFAGGALIIGLISLLFINIQENFIFAIMATIFLMTILLLVVVLSMKGIKRGYRFLRASLQARREAQQTIQLAIVSPPIPPTYKIGDDGEIMEVVDEKSKRDEGTIDIQNKTSQI